MITEGKKKKKGTEKTGCVSKTVVPSCGARVGGTWSTVLGAGHLITAGKLEEPGMAESTMRGPLGLAWGERLKDWKQYRQGKWRGSPAPHEPEGGESFPGSLRDFAVEKWGDKEQKGDKSETSGASGFGCERTVSPGTASSKKLQKVLCSGCLSRAELSVMKFPEGEILAKPWVHQQVIHTPAFCFSPPLSWLFACLLRAFT